MRQPTRFDYNALDDGMRILKRTDEIKVLVKRTADDIIAIGERLLEVKALLPHGAFGDWLSAEFDWSQDTAGRLMNVASRFGDIPQIADFAPSALYLLASPSTPESARQEAVGLAQAGETITHTEAKAIVSAHLKPSERETQDSQPEEQFYLDEHFDKLDATPQHQCPKCGFKY